MKILVISASPRNNSHSRVLANVAFNYFKEKKLEVNMIDLNENRVDSFRGFGEEYSEETLKAIEAMNEHDLFIISTPVYNLSFSSALKNLFEHLNVKNQKGKVAGFIMNAGGPISHIQVHSNLNTMMNYFAIFSNPKAVYVNYADFDKEMKVSSELVKERIKYLVDSSIDIAGKLK
jgi:NAD(P)H-dependent FMN reductase